MEQERKNVVYLAAVFNSYPTLQWSNGTDNESSTGAYSKHFSVEEESLLANLKWEIYLMEANILGLFEWD